MENSENNRNMEKLHLRSTMRGKQSKFLKRSKTLQVAANNKTKQIEDISIYSNKYSKPIIETPKSSYPIVINQEMPTLTPISFSSNPVDLTCPFCKKRITSNVEINFNCCTCLLYLLISILCALPCLFCSAFFHLENIYCNCDCNCCCDATHKCPNCQKIIGIHESSPNC